MSLTILIMQPDALLRAGLQRFFRQLHPDAEVVCVESLMALGACAQLRHATLIVSDLSDGHTPAERGIEWLLWLQCQREGQPLLIISEHCTPELASRLESQADISLATPYEEQVQLSQSVMRVMAGEKTLSARIGGGARQKSRRVALTATEQRVLGLLHKGYSVSWIADEMCRSIKTISSHKRNIMSRMGVRSEVELFARVYETQWDVG